MIRILKNVASVINDEEEENCVLPDIVTLNEINLRNNKKVELERYKCISKNRKEGNMGGVATYVLDKDAGQTLKVSEGTEGNEYIITRHNQFKNPINVINVYGDVESRTSV